MLAQPLLPAQKEAWQQSSLCQKRSALLPHSFPRASLQLFLWLFMCEQDSSPSKGNLLWKAPGLYLGGAFPSTLGFRVDPSP